MCRKATSLQSNDSRNAPSTAYIRLHSAVPQERGKVGRGAQGTSFSSIVSSAVNRLLNIQYSPPSSIPI
ncbi:hypothetical protein Y032_0076g996 [Ancylostoma ceylanicum]|uniref:Uncharacterized protein n=1 Tax=Ancylostoma ceylanicum TaxID=53326 RepID=A0A016TUY9_9BILA|nr:hypothetical protein Y032_0076g996 [Ancylostoma ceylanicum]